MYEELYQKLPDLEEYLRRIGVKKPENCDEAELDELIFAHQCRVPFENVDVMNKKEISLGIEDLYDKIVVRERGGFCFELNALFTSLLQACGYDAYGCRCRIIQGRDFIPPVLHRGTIIKIDDELYYGDVGFGGPQPAGCIKVKDGYEKEAAGQVYRIDRADDYWWTLSRRQAKGYEKILQFTTIPQDEVDFIPLNVYCSTHPDSVFVQQYMVNRRLKNGKVSITGMKFSKVEDGAVYEEKIETSERLEELLKQEIFASVER